VKQPAPLDRRRAGLLLHPTSLPGEGTSGVIGAHAYRFVDLLAELGCTVWQTLPLGPTHDDLSPYQSYSALAGNPRLIDWGWVESRGWSEPGECAAEAAWCRFYQQADVEEQKRFARFQSQHAHWLPDYARFIAFKAHHAAKPWWQWPKALRDRDATALATLAEQLAPEISALVFEQFLFFRQWHDLKSHANAQGVHLFGDLPIFVGEDSADVWAHRELFQLDDNGRPLKVAGVPPDYFSKTGQRWGNPLYDWAVHERTGYRWWIERLQGQLELFDLIRIDHFRGFESYWEIPATATTAIDGQWRKGPGEAFFRHIAGALDSLPLVAEDLGMITEQVHALRKKVGLPGMKILQFAFDGDPKNSYLPHNHAADFVVYTGTHDNDTTLGWWKTLDSVVKQQVTDYLSTSDSMPWSLIRAAMQSVATLAIIPMQDLLELDCTHRMNQPGVQKDNWSWRFAWEQLNEDQRARLAEMIRLYQR
jgi:4-alpha-glucanotransferase